MKLIDYQEYRKKWTPRTAVVLLLVEALATGFFLGVALMEYAAPNKSSVWMIPLVLGFASGVGALEATLVALRNCRPPTATQASEATAH